MNKLLIAAFSVLVAFPVFSQTANCIFFTEEGEPFYVVMNGQRYNEQPQTNVRVDGVMPGAYKTKIIFADQSILPVEKTIYPEAFKETTFNIKRKKESKVSKGIKNFAKEATDNMHEDLGTDTMTVSEKKDWYVMRLLSVNPIPVAAQPAAMQAPQPQPVQQQVTYQQTTVVPAQQTTVTTTQTTTTTNAQPATNVSIGVNMNVDGTGGSIQLNATDATMGTATYYEETTVTTTGTAVGTTTTPVAAPAHYVMPGYNGPIGCPWPMSDQDFAAARASVASQDFADTKMSVARQVISANCLFAHQVRDLTSLFDFEDDKLQFAKMAYPSTYDQGNYFKVNDVFDFEDSVIELNQAIGR